MEIDESFLAQGSPDPASEIDESNPPERLKGPSIWRRHGLQIGILVVGAIIWILFLIAAPDVFTSADIYRAFASATPLFVIMALALTFVVITGEIDLSFPAVMALSMASFVFVVEHGGFIGLAFLAALATGALAGLFNGFLVGKMGIPAVVITIGTSFLFRGIELAAMSGRGVALTDAAFDAFKTILVGRIFWGIPMQFVWTIVIAVVLWALLNRSRFGARMSRVPWNLSGGPMIIRLRSPSHHDGWHRHSARRHGVRGRLVVLVGACGR